MKIPLSWLREFADVPSGITPDEIEAAFVKVGFEVEEILIQGADLTGPLVVARVESIEELTEHKKPIRYVGLDCGEGSVRYVICGARNFSQGDLVVAALPGAILPGNFAISARETYGKTSNGMICSARELGISDDHEGIIVLPSTSVIGSDAIELLEINDMIIDVAVNPDRGYALSARGLAREIAISLGVAFRDPAAIDYLGSHQAVGGEVVQVRIDDRSGADLITLRTLDSVDVLRETPLWMSRRLEKCGMRKITLAVDITNYVMLELGQPLHAFDAQKIDGTLVVTRATSSSDFTTLDSQKRVITPGTLMIGDDKKYLAIAGTMGGLDSEVTDTTRRIALEAAHFDPISIAKNSRSQRLSSEASRRLERNVDPAVANVASARATSLLIELAGARLIGESSDGEVAAARTITFNPGAISQLIGFEYTEHHVESALVAIGGSVEVTSADSWTFTAPTWRADLEVISDLAEEVARVNGFDLIPSRLPTGKAGSSLTPMQYRKRGVAHLLANLGFSETYNYPFVSPEMVKTLGFVGPRAASFRIANPMSEEAPLLRTHLLPGLLQALSRNLSRGAKDVALFEIGTVFRDISTLTRVTDVSTKTRPSDALIKEIYASVPAQPLFVGGVVAGSLDRKGWWGSGRTFDWSDAVALADRIIRETGNRTEIVQSDLSPWHPGRCAEITINGKALAHAGELHPRILEELNLPPRTVAFAVILSELPIAPVARAQPILTMPAAIQDISLVVERGVPSARVESALRAGAGDLLESITLFDRYDQGESFGPEKVSLAFTMTFRAPDRTLTADEVSGFRASAAASAISLCGAIIRD
jgi:phenylalanyl-tRNA synthetase beta chain